MEKAFRSAWQASASAIVSSINSGTAIRSSRKLDTMAAADRKPILIAQLGLQRLPACFQQDVQLSFRVRSQIGNLDRIFFAKHLRNLGQLGPLQPEIPH